MSSSRDREKVRSQRLIDRLHESQTEQDAESARTASKRRAQYIKRIADSTGVRLLAEGDSWFDYPVPFHNDTLSHLEGRLTDRAHILSLAHYGDRTLDMLTAVQRKRLIATLKDPELGPFDALLFSGGGNDLTGDRLDLYVQDKVQGLEPRNALQEKRLKAGLDLIAAAFDELMCIRAQWAPTMPIFLNAYDFAPVTGEGVCHIGPWLQPALLTRGWTQRDEQEVIVETLLRTYRDRLCQLAKGHDAVHIVDTQGSLDRRTHWANELHPTNAGFEIIASKFEAALQAAGVV